MFGSAGTQYYWIVLLGQFVASFSNAIFFGGGPLLSETWFPSSERATATAIAGAIAPQIGISIALGITPIIIHSPLTEMVCNETLPAPEGMVEQWTSTVHQRWLYYQTAVAGLAIVTMLLTFLGERVILEWKSYKNAELAFLGLKSSVHLFWLL